MHTREHLVLLRPGRCGLVVHTLFYDDEVRSVDEFRTDTGSIAEQELKVAHLLVITFPWWSAEKKRQCSYPVTHSRFRATTRS
jgi:non-homologous end joining protein Ku